MERSLREMLGANKVIKFDILKACLEANRQHCDGLNDSETYIDEIALYNILQEEKIDIDGNEPIDSKKGLEIGIISYFNEPCVNINKFLNQAEDFEAEWDRIIYEENDIMKVRTTVYPVLALIQIADDIKDNLKYCGDPTPYVDEEWLDFGDEGFFNPTLVGTGHEYMSREEYYSRKRGE